MNLFTLLRAIPLADLLMIVGLTTSLLLITILYLRGKRQYMGSGFVSPHNKKTNGKGLNVWSIGRYILRLVGFAILAFVCIGGGVLIYKDYQEIRAEIAPSPSTIEIPGNLSFQVEEVIFTGGDGINLAGWYIPPHNGATIILLHGYGSNRTSMIWHASRLVDAGFGILMYDERGSGESEGKNRSHGWQDAPDVGGAIKYLNNLSRPDTNLIGIAGCSIGGQIALQGAASYPEIKAVWADGASGIRAGDEPLPNNWASGIAFLSNYLLDWMLSEQLDIEPPPPISEIIDRIAPRPVVMVAGGFPRPYFGNEARRILYYTRTAGPGLQVWIIPDTIHCDGPSRRPEEYANRMLEFFDKAFGVK